MALSPQSGDSDAAALSVAAQLKEKLLPTIKQAPTAEKVAVTAEMKVQHDCAKLFPMQHGRPILTPAVLSSLQAVQAYRSLRTERMNVRLVGIRKKKADEAAKEEAEKGKA